LRGQCPKGRGGSSPPSDTNTREVSRGKEGGREASKTEIFKSSKCPGQGGESEPIPTAGNPGDSTIEDMKGNNSNGIAAVRQRERIIAALSPLSPRAIVSNAPSPLAHIRPLREVKAGSWTHGFARLDVSGRIRDAVVFGVLGWDSGTLVLVRRENDRLVVTVGANGAPLDGRGRLHIPETERRALSLCSQSGVLLSANKRVGVLMVTPAALCDELVS